MHGSVTVEHHGGTIVVVVAGDLGMDGEYHSHFGPLLTEIDHTERPDVIIDLASVHYLGSEALGRFVRLWKRVCLRKGRMAVCAVAPPIEELLRISKLHVVWPIYENREAAFTALST